MFDSTMCMGHVSFDPTIFHDPISHFTFPTCGVWSDVQTCDACWDDEWAAETPMAEFLVEQPCVGSVVRNTFIEPLSPSSTVLETLPRSSSVPRNLGSTRGAATTGLKCLRLPPQCPASPAITASPDWTPRLQGDHAFAQAPEQSKCVLCLSEFI